MANSQDRARNKRSRSPTQQIAPSNEQARLDDQSPNEHTMDTSNNANPAKRQKRSSKGNKSKKKKSQSNSNSEVSTNIKEPPVTWEDRYEQLKDYKAEHGHTRVPKGYINKKLWCWVATQRYQYKLYQDNDQEQQHDNKSSSVTMTLERINLLNALDFDWGTNNASWEERFQELVAFQQTYGHVNVSKRTNGGEFKQLGLWVSRQRSEFKRLLAEGGLGTSRSKRKSHMTLERIQQLDAIGFQWELSNGSGSKKQTTIMDPSKIASAITTALSQKNYQSLSSSTSSETHSNEDKCLKSATRNTVVLTDSNLSFCVDNERPHGEKIALVATEHASSPQQPSPTQAWLTRGNITPQYATCDDDEEANPVSNANDDSEDEEESFLFARNAKPWKRQDLVRPISSLL